MMIRAARAQEEAIFWEPGLSLKYVKAKDYPDAARRVIKEMHRQVSPLKFYEHGLAKRGLLVRHLVMPGNIAGTEAIMRFLAEEVSPDTFVNVMGQYYPAGRVSRAQFVEINRHITDAEYRQALSAARAAGLRMDVRNPRQPVSSRFLKGTAKQHPVVWVEAPLIVSSVSLVLPPVTHA